MHRQMDLLSFAPPMHGTSDVTLDFVEALGRVTPGTLNFVKPYSGGSESIESAIKFTRQYHRQSGQPGKYKFVSRYHGYHGATYGAIAASVTLFRAPSRWISEGLPTHPLPRPVFVLGRMQPFLRSHVRGHYRQ